MHTACSYHASIVFSLYIEATCFADADKPSQTNNDYFYTVDIYLNSYKQSVLWN